MIWATSQAGSRLWISSAAAESSPEPHGLRTTFHPDQFVVLNSPKPEVVEHSIAELAYQAEVAEWVGADVINVHAGGVYGDTPSALEQLRRGIDRLSDKVRQRLTLENDEKSHTVPPIFLPSARQSAFRWSMMSTIIAATPMA